MTTNDTIAARPGVVPRVHDLVRGAVAGLTAGTIFIGLSGWFAASVGSEPLAPFKLIATLVAGTPAAEASVGLGLAIHLVLSALFGVVFAVAAPWLRSRESIVPVAFAYGGAIYVVDFLFLAHTSFPQFQATNQPLEFAAHLLFGGLIGAAMSTDLPPHGVTHFTDKAPLRYAAALASGGVALIHIALAAEHLEEKYYIGVLFVVGSALLTYVAIQLIRRPDLTAWIVGGLVHAGMLAAYALSRTVGLPSGYMESMIGVMGSSTLALEVLFLAVALSAIVAARRTGPPSVGRPSNPMAPTYTSAAG